MKSRKIITIFVITVVFITISCENNSESKIYSRIEKEVNLIKIVDTHEHLMSEKLRKQSNPDLFYLFKDYISSDLISAGMSKQQLEYIKNSNEPIEERWKIFYPFWEKARNTAYAQYVIRSARDLFGVEDINPDTYIELNKKVAESNKIGWYEYVLKEKAGIEISILDPLDRYFLKDSFIDDRFFVSVKRFDNYIKLSRKRLEKLESDFNIKISSLDELLKCLENDFKLSIEKDRIVGVKSGLAYSRSLKYDEVEKEEAERIFNTSILSNQSVSQEEKKKLQDFMMHQVLKNTEKSGLPLQIHTGILAGNQSSNPLENTNARHLANLFLKYPDLNFVIFHGSYPYMAELGVLAKKFPNVYIDMCWMHIISPEASKQYLEEWLLTVPSNKIMAFGGDFGNSVEGIYAHSIIARENITEVLTDMVMKKYISESDAVKIAKRLLRDNAIELYRLNLAN